MGLSAQDERKRRGRASEREIGRKKSGGLRDKGMGGKFIEAGLESVFKIKNCHSSIVIQFLDGSGLVFRFYLEFMI